MQVAVFGLGYVGTVTAACLASEGHAVWGVDVDTVKVDMIRGGQSPVEEPGLSELVAEVVRLGRLNATTSPAVALDRADISLICVGTPSSAQGDADLRFVNRAASEIIEQLALVDPPESGFHSILVRSTVPPGTVDGLVTDIVARAKLDEGHITVGLGMCPEFLREGSGIADFYAPPLLVVGTDDSRVTAAVTSLFDFLGHEVCEIETGTAEALKYTCNAFHAIKISFANEIGRLFRAFDVDAREVMNLVCLDTSLNISPAYLRPGFAFGGSCLPKDLRSMLSLARKDGTDLPLLSGVLATNELCIRDVLDRVIASGARSIALFGLSFKSDSDDLRESPYVELAERLIGKGYEIRIYDAIVNPARMIGTNRRHMEERMPHLRSLLTNDPKEALVGAELAVVATWEPAVVDALLYAPPPSIIDLCGRMGSEIEGLTAYSGAAW